MEGPYRPLARESARNRRLSIAAYRFAYPFLRLVFAPLYRPRVRGARHLKEKRAAISVMNHCIYVEWFFLCHAAWPRQPRFSMEEANIRRRDVGWANRLMGGFGIPDDHPMAVAPKVRQLLEKGELVHFFPEGVLRHRNQNPSAFLPGAAWFACLNNVPLIPVAEVLTRTPIHRIAPWWPPQVTLIVGTPLLPEDYRIGGDRLRDRAIRMTADCEKIIRDAITAESEGKERFESPPCSIKWR